MSDCPVDGWNAVEDNSDYKADPMPEIESSEEEEDDD